MDIRKLSLRTSGMFSNVNEVVQQLYLAERGGYKFIIDWSKSCYKDETLFEDPWLYYFKPCFRNIEISNIKINRIPQLVCGKTIACTKDNIITPRLFNGNCDPLLLPKNKNIANKIIKNYINVNEVVQNKIDSFSRKYFHGNVIGLHIRGGGKMDGGASLLRKSYQLKYGVPFDLYFNSVDRILEDYQDSLIFVCSDSSKVINEVNNKYGDRVITYNATRSEFGEIHKYQMQNKESNISYKLGLDVLVEAFLLSKVNILVHGSSNVTNFVLCNNPFLTDIFVYQNNFSITNKLLWFIEGSIKKVKFKLTGLFIQ